MTLAIYIQDGDTTSGEIAYRDEVLNAGSIFCHDFADPYCWLPTAPVVNSAEIANLVDGAPVATLVKPGAALDYLADRGFQKTATDNTHYIKLGNALDYFQTNLDHDFAVIIWATLPAADPSSTGGFLLRKCTGTNNAAPGIQIGVSGGYATIMLVDVKFSNNTANRDARYNGAIGSAPGLHQFGVVRVGTTLSIVYDGALVAPTPIAAIATMTANAAPITLGAQPTSSFTAIDDVILHRALAEDLTVSGLSAAAVVAADYAANSGRFV